MKNLIFNRNYKKKFIKNVDVFIDNKKCNLKETEFFYNHLSPIHERLNIILSKYLVPTIGHVIKNKLRIKEGDNWKITYKKINIELIEKLTKKFNLKKVKTIELKDKNGLNLGINFKINKNPELLQLFFLNYMECILANQYNITEKNIKNRIVIDAGAHLGEFSIYAAKLGAKKVYAFEPVTKTYNLLKKQIKINNLENQIIPIKMALGDKNESAIINFDYAGDECANIKSDIKTKYFEKIKITTIDTFIKKNEKVGFIKMDVEGYEEKVLIGATKTIKKDKPVLAFSAYHHPSDKKILPTLVKKIRPDYKIKLLKRYEEDFYCE